MTLIFGGDDEQSIWTNHLFHLICHTFMMKFIPKNSPLQYGMVITTFDDDDNDDKHLGALIRYKDPETNEMRPVGRTDPHKRYNDFYFGIRVSWNIPTYQRQPEDYYYD